MSRLIKDSWWCGMPLSKRIIETVGSSFFSTGRIERSRKKEKVALWVRIWFFNIWILIIAISYLISEIRIRHVIRSPLAFWWCGNYITWKRNQKSLSLKYDYDNEISGGKYQNDLLQKRTFVHHISWKFKCRWISLP